MILDYLKTIIKQKFQRAGRDGSVRSCGLLIFAMALEKDAGVDGVNLSDFNAVNIVDEN